VIRIHHVSDVHFGPSQYKATNWFGFLPQAAARNADAYVSHLKRLPAASFPDLIIVSGDLATFASEEEMNSASDFITKILDLDGWTARKALPPGSPRILVVPGNHDLDWSKTSPEERHERYDRLSKALFGNGLVISSRYWNKKADPWFDFGDEANLFIYLLNSTHYGGTDDPVLKKIYEAITENPNAGISEEEKKALSRKVKNDPGFVVDLDRLRIRMAEVPRTRIKIAVVHHNPNHVPSDDQDSFDTIMNAGPLKSALLEAGFDLVLHGHRHLFHCSVESHPAATFSNNRCYFISADSLGVKENAPFLELDINREASQTSVEVREFTFSSPAVYGNGMTRCWLTLGQSEAELLGKVIAAGWNQAKPDPGLKQAIDIVFPKLQETHARLTQWGGRAKWVEHFHFQLHAYRRLWATALYDRATIMHPSYQRYLREQYRERLSRMHRLQQRLLYFSPEISKAIIRCQWMRFLDSWSGYQIAKPTRSTPSSLEIARIIVIDPASIDLTLDIEILANLAYDHALCAIPLFVIDRQFIQPEQEIDFAVGTDVDGQPLKACAFNRNKGEVEEQSPLDSYQLVSTFEELLKHPRLQTVQEFMGEGRMWTDPKRVREMAAQYAKARKPSSLLIKILNEHLPESGEAGVDLCCGTGNYTAPFTNRFRKLWGVDISEEMLSTAKARVAGVEWIRADAKTSTLPDRSCDAAWMISALHYFLGDEQLLLLREVYRILKPGGVFVADTEFSEQHSSMWIVDYFPSLRRRYDNRLFPEDRYRRWLQQAGFQAVEFKTCEYPPEEGDAFLRIGQHKPELYLDEAIRIGIPAFQVMDLVEKRTGLARLENEISTGEVKGVQQRYVANAKLPGDLGILIARK
jgi:ubiquinone/menaquinone biosynthesis C-methylase UbiE